MMRKYIEFIDTELINEKKTKKCRPIIKIFVIRMEDQGTILFKLSVILPELAVAGEGDKHRGELKRRGRNQSKR